MRSSCLTPLGCPAWEHGTGLNPGHIRSTKWVAVEHSGPFQGLESMVEARKLPESAILHCQSATRELQCRATASVRQPEVPAPGGNSQLRSISGFRLLNVIYYGTTRSCCKIALASFRGFSPVSLQQGPEREQRQEGAFKRQDAWCLNQAGASWGP